MMVWLAELWQSEFSWLNLIGYQTFRTIMAALTALMISLILGPRFIRHLQDRQIGQQVRTLGPESHFEKQGTPTMGGAMILTVITLSTVLWSDWRVNYVWLCLFVLLSFGFVGWFDDYKKMTSRSHNGLSAKMKYLLLSIFALLAVAYLYQWGDPSIRTQLVIPFTNELNWSLGWLAIPLGYFVLVGSSNGVNLTDGLDGLAIMPCVMVAGALGVFSYVSGHAVFSDYLLIPFIPGTGEMAIFCAAIAGAGLGFLWFNTYPAQVFMGDVGSLALGGALGVVAFVTRQELVFFIMGGVFVMETVSVILQVGSYKLMGKRIFKMAPIHHHFELKGWAEPKVIVRFWIISFILVLIGLATLKIR